MDGTSICPVCDRSLAAHGLFGAYDCKAAAQDRAAEARAQAQRYDAVVRTFDRALNMAGEIANVFNP